MENGLSAEAQRQSGASKRPGEVVQGANERVGARSERREERSDDEALTKRCEYLRDMA